jgi:hypothetical protein
MLTIAQQLVPAPRRRNPKKSMIIWLVTLLYFRKVLKFQRNNKPETNIS